MFNLHWIGWIAFIGSMAVTWIQTASALMLPGPRSDVLSRFHESRHSIALKLSTVTTIASSRSLSVRSSRLSSSRSSTRTTLYASPSRLDPDQQRRRQLLQTLLMLTSVTQKPSGARASEEIINDVEDAKSKSSDRNIMTPPLDEREYTTFQLPNGLTVLLVSDDTTTEVAAAMDVHVGACSDTVPGLAHFNEHMLFLGTRKYPDENSFETFLSQNGGASNAFTDAEDTVYYFTLTGEADRKVEEALLRFGSFFECPLFTPAATGRELNAIESEHAKNLQSDAFRSFQLRKAQANPEHPFHKFFTGNKKTLLEDTRATGIDLRQELVEFYSTYYSANQMTLAIVAPQSLDQLTQMVTNAFGKIPNRDAPRPEQAWQDIPPFDKDSPSLIPAFGHIVEVVPVQELRQITISWPILYQNEQEGSRALLSKPGAYPAHLLGHEGPLSLISYLKKKGWANSVAVGSSEELSNFDIFDVTIGLTKRGEQKVDEVLEATFSYLRLMREKGTPEYVYQEVLRLAELQWRFSTKGNAGNYVQSLVKSMQQYPPELYVAGPRRLALEDYESLTNEPRSRFPSMEALQKTKNAVDYYVGQCTVDNALITVFSKAFGGKTDQKEIIYGTDFRVRSIPSTTLQQWRSCPDPKKLGMDFPRPNPFLPSEAGLAAKFSVQTAQKAASRTFESRLTPIAPPRVIRDDERWTVYYKEDDRFGLPKAYLIFQVLTTDLFATPMKAALANLFELCVLDKLGEYAYDAGLAGLTYDIKVLPRGIRLTFGGFNDKLLEFASYVSKKLTKDVAMLLPRSDADFDRYKDQIMRALSAFDVKQPYAHAAYYTNLALQPRKFQYSNAILREETRKITLPDLTAYVKTVWSSGKGVALVQGNLYEEEARKLVAAIGDILPFRPTTDFPPYVRALPLPSSDAAMLPPRLLVAEPNPSNENSVSLVILECLGRSEKDHVLMELLSGILNEPFFNELRTQKQLGYIVNAGLRGVGESRTMSFLVQSSVAPADALTLQILQFLERVPVDILQKLSKADLAVYIKSLIDNKTETDKDLIVEVTRNWSEVSSGRLQFDRLQAEARVLLDITKDDLLEFWQQLYVRDGRRILVTEVVPRQGVAASEEPPRSAGYVPGDYSKRGLVLGVDDIDLLRRDLEKLL